MDAGASPDDCSSTCARGRAISTLHPLLSSRIDFNIKKAQVSVLGMLQLQIDEPPSNLD